MDWAWLTALPQLVIQVPEELSWFAMYGWIIFLALGAILVVVEMFLPGFGVPGGLGIVLLIIGIILKAESWTEGLLMFAVMAVVLGAGFILVLQSAAKGKLRRSPLVLKNSTSRQEGFSSVEDLEYFLGREGQTVTVLRPAGQADFDGVKLDVVSDSEFIPEGTMVRVTKVEGRRIVVGRRANE